MAAQVYKVVWLLNDGRLVSTLPGELSRAYTPGEEALPTPPSFLYAFGLYKAALDFWQVNKGPYMPDQKELQIWQGTGDLVHVLLPSAGTYPTQLFWDDQRYALDYYPGVWPCHPGTVWLRSVTLEKKIWPVSEGA